MKRPSSQKYRKIALRFHYYTCVVCGSKKNLTVHHVDGDCWNNSPDNLVFLCDRCHKLADNNNRTSILVRINAYVVYFRYRRSLYGETFKVKPFGVDCFNLRKKTKYRNRIRR